MVEDMIKKIVTLAFIMILSIGILSGCGLKDWLGFGEETYSATFEIVTIVSGVESAEEVGGTITINNVLYESNFTLNDIKEDDALVLEAGELEGYTFVSWDKKLADGTISPNFATSKILTIIFSPMTSNIYVANFEKDVV